MPLYHNKQINCLIFVRFYQILFHYNIFTKEKSENAGCQTPVFRINQSPIINGVDGSQNPTGSTPHQSPVLNGVDGSRTRVQKPIPCPSTIIVRYPDRYYSDLFPRLAGNEHPAYFGRFMNTPMRAKLNACRFSHLMMPGFRCVSAPERTSRLRRRHLQLTLQMLTDYYFQRLF